MNSRLSKTNRARGFWELMLRNGCSIRKYEPIDNNIARKTQKTLVEIDVGCPLRILANDKSGQ
jgi:hypothetical protein